MTREPVALRAAVAEVLQYLHEAHQGPDIDAAYARLDALVNVDDLCRWSLASPGIGWPWTDAPATVQALMASPARRDMIAFTVECPYCRSAHRHAGPATDAEPGHWLAHCGNRGRKGYAIVRTDMTNSLPAMDRARSLARRRGRSA